MANSDKSSNTMENSNSGMHITSNDKARQTMRSKAEKIVESKTRDLQASDNPISSKEVQNLIYELRVHQIELEMQNGELRQTQVELDSSRARYYDLYDLAPVGYITLNETGMIFETNLTAANLLAASRSSLTKLPLSRFINHDDQDSYYLYFKKLGLSGSPVACELKMHTMDGKPFHGRLEGIAREGADGVNVFRIVLSDVSSFRPS
jgi:PAS domain-containing protein